MIADRANTIRRLIQDADLDAATLALIDFAVDFSQTKALRNEASNVRGLFSHLRTEERNHLSTEDSLRLRNRLMSQAQDLLDQIETDYTASLEPSAVSVTQPAPPKEKKSIFRCEQITRRYGDSFSLQPLSFELKAGEITALVGFNGSGKSTLLEMVACRRLPNEGDVYYPEFDFNDGWHSFKENIGYIPHQVEAWGQTLEVYLKYIVAMNGVRGQDNLDLVNQILKRLDLEEDAHFTFSQLSAGFRMRSALAEIMALRPRLMVLDEPLANLDIPSQARFLTDLRALADSAKYPTAIIISSQHLFEIESIADNVILLEKGVCEFSGPKTGLRGDGEWLSFEIQSNANKASLSEILNLAKIPHQIELFGIHHILSIPERFSAGYLLTLLTANQVEITYFRDISASSMKFFVKKYDQ
jgi:ABC-2 type transport system ATP-binding protein